ncbi:Cytochrome P450 monooxygenase patH [Colletotrichum sp. SAR 10_77]|nr:Cytochrome P450 monooxygenase patH [Colletotrichum sp. SAR 10_77]
MSLFSSVFHPAALAFILLPFIYLIGSWALAARRPKNYPPGPPAILGLGNILQVPPEKSFLKFTEWKQTYGDMVGLKMGGQNLVVLQTAELVRELIEKRGAIYSDRPTPYIPSQIINPGTVIFQPNDHTIKKTRTAMQYMFRPAELKRVFAVQTAQSAILMRKILDDPTEFRTHMKYWALATPLSILCGRKIQEEGPSSTEEYFATQARWLRFLKPAQAPPVDLFPFMKHLPDFLAKWRKEALVLRKDMWRMIYYMLDGAKLQHGTIAKGLRSHDNESVMSRIIMEAETNEDMRMGDHELAVFGGGTLDAAVDTVIASTSSVVMAFAAFPEVQKRVQAEVDSIWEDSPPTEERLPEAKFLRAVVMEAMRWRGAAPQAVPRVLARDDTYRGYNFTKGTVFIMNVWAIHRDEKWYENPEEFNPDRYMDNQWGVRPEMKVAAEKENRRPTYNFGAGRRMCPGLDYAENQVLIVLAKLAWDFNVVAKKPLDLDINTGFHSNLVLEPNSFDVDFVARGDFKRGKIVEDGEKAKEVVSAWVE